MACEQHVLTIDLIGNAAPTERARAAVARVANNSDPVLISAEPGFSSSAIARTIHDSSERAVGPFVRIDCATASADDLNRYFFARQASGGSLVFEQLDELPTPLQTSLASILDQTQIEGDDTPGGPACDVRVLATVGSAIEEELVDGKLRRELFMRFTQRVELPPLRFRATDIPTLIGCLVGESATTSKVPAPSFTREALTLLAALPWRRNVEELREVVNMLVLGAVGGTVRLEDVLGYVPVEPAYTTHASTASLRDARTRFERQYIASVLHRHRGHMEDAARALGIQRTNLYRKIRQLGLAKARS